MKDTASPRRLQVAASLKPAKIASPACACAGVQSRACSWPGTKITVLPATENCPLPLLHHKSSAASPLSPISRVGLRFDPACARLSSVISNPNGNSSSADAGQAASIAAASITAAAAPIKNFLESIPSLDTADLVRSRALVIGGRGVDQIGPIQKSFFKKSPRPKDAGT